MHVNSSLKQSSWAKQMHDPKGVLILLQRVPAIII